MPRFRPFTAPLRTFLLCLAVALPGAVAAQGDDPVLIELGGTRERASFVLERFEIAVRGVAANQGLPFSDDVFEQLYPFLPNFLEQRVSELVLIDFARTRGLSVDDEAIDAIIDGVRASTGGDPEVFELLLGEAGFRDEAQLREIVAEGELVQLAYQAILDGVTISEGELRVAYQGARERFTTPAEACVDHILVGDLELAESLLEELAAGADFAALAQEHSTDPGSAAAGGALGCLPRGVTVAPFDEAAFTAELGAVVGPVETQFGYHLITVSSRTEPRPQPFDEVREALERDLRFDRAQLTLDRYVEIANVRTYPERIPPFTRSQD